MTKLLIILSMSFSSTLPICVLLNNNLNMPENGKTNNNKKIDISKWEIPLYKINNFWSITDDLLLTYLLTKAMEQEQNKTIETFFNNIIMCNNSNWFTFEKINFNIPSQPKPPIFAKLIVKATDQCQLYTGEQTINFELEIPEVNKDITDMQYYINRYFSSSFTIDDFKQKNNNDYILKIIDQKLFNYEKYVFGSNGILDLLYNQHSLKISRQLNPDPYNDINDPNKRNDFISEYTYYLEASNGWQGNLKINHLTVYEQPLLDVNYWKVFCSLHDVLSHPGIPILPIKIFQDNCLKWNEETADLVWHNFFNFEGENTNVGIHIFGDKITQSLKDDFYEKYSRFFTLTFKELLLISNPKNPEYEITIEINQFPDIPFFNLEPNDKMQFTVVLVD